MLKNLRGVFAADVCAPLSIRFTRNVIRWPTYRSGDITPRCVSEKLPTSRSVHSRAHEGNSSYVQAVAPCPRGVRDNLMSSVLRRKPSWITSARVVSGSYQPSGLRHGREKQRQSCRTRRICRQIRRKIFFSNDKNICDCIHKMYIMRADSFCTRRKKISRKIAKIESIARI